MPTLVLPTRLSPEALHQPRSFETLGATSGFKTILRSLIESSLFPIGLTAQSRHKTGC
jgi:hypothetical protein